MSDLASRLAGLSPAQRKLLEKRIAAQQKTPEPIAIVGMGCRFPKAPNLHAFWELISNCQDGMCEIPSSRWSLDEFYDPNSDAEGQMSVRTAALLDDARSFDPQFFGITPREAAKMDPQQRLLLEVAWEAMENAGIAPDRFGGSQTGVYVGIGGTDYSKVPIPYDNYYRTITPHSGTGNALSIAANRLSYIFDLHGPSMAVDTACSSSSLAVHLASESLRRGECTAALAGGVNMILTPETTIAFSKARMLSPRGRCTPFDASADGYVRSEGCGIVLLKRLTDAKQDGDHILAILRGSAVNQDGRTSGISAPNGQLQKEVIRAALKSAGLEPDAINYIEAHGTGTPLGDPIEMQALGELFPADQEGKSPLYITSAKANVGHMETVSGLVGLIKVVLMMQRGTIPPQTHFEQLNPHINLAGTRLVVPTRPIAWASREQTVTAGISSFGFGGTNTHLILQSVAIAESQDGSLPEDGHLVKLAAKSDSALATMARNLRDELVESPDHALADIAYSMNCGRVDFHHRASIVADSNNQLAEALTAIAEEKRSPHAKQGTVRTVHRPRVAFLFTGQGSQWVGMGKEFYHTYPRFRQAIDYCDQVLSKRWDHSLLEVMFQGEQGTSTQPLLHQTEYTQPALFAIEYALADLWQSWGAEPDLLLGHSVGEYPAAVVAGVMGLDDGLNLIAERAHLMQKVTRRGGMAVIFANEQRVTELIAPLEGDLVVAVVNGPENVVISGDIESVEQAVAHASAVDIRSEQLQVSHAFHSPHMDDILDEFETFAAALAFHPPQRDLISNLTGKLLTEAPTPRYWRDHLRSAVQFAAGMETLAAGDPSLIIEVGPTASLLGMGRRCQPSLSAAWLPSLRKGQSDRRVLAASVGEYYCRGGQFDWNAWEQVRRKPLLLPNYPFERTDCWYDVKEEERRLRGNQAGPLPVMVSSGEKNALIGARLSTVWNHTLFESSISASQPAFLIDHQVQGSPVMPAAAYLEQALEAASDSFGPGLHGLEDVSIQQAMFLGGDTRRRMQISVAPESGGKAVCEIYSQQASANDAAQSDPAPSWAMHASVTVTHAQQTNAPASTAKTLPREFLASATHRTSRREFYQSMQERGLAYGPNFQVLGEIGREQRSAVAEIELPESVARELDSYHLHPALGDALLQAVAGVVPLENDGSFSPFTYMPVAMRRLELFAPIPSATALFVFVERISEEDAPSPELVSADISLVDTDGNCYLRIEAAQVQRIGKRGLDAHDDEQDFLYDLNWKQRDDAPPPAEQPIATWIIFTDTGESPVVEHLAQNALARAEKVIVVYADPTLTQMQELPESSDASLQFKVNPLDETNFDSLFARCIEAGIPGRVAIVNLWPLDIIPIGETANDAQTCWKSESHAGCAPIVTLLRRLVRQRFSTSPELLLVTQGAQQVGPTSTGRLHLAQTPIWGLGRVAIMEQAEFKPRLIDLDPQATPETAASQLTEIANADPTESQIALRDNVQYVLRLSRRESTGAADSNTSADMKVPQGTPCQLRINQPGSFDGLRYVPFERKLPEPGQVEIEVRATGLNFSDVLKALGLYPGIKDAIVPLGIEAAGRVTAIGADVSRFQVGDDVMGVLPYAFASHARSADYALVHKPPTIDYDEACTIPITFMTAYYGLVHLARLQPGERLLIHAAAGGVGLAAIQIAKHLGAEIYGTAGSDSKRDLVRSLGAKHVFSSRSVDFADEILSVTERQGVDVVLNSLPGEAIPKSLGILRAYGRFLEIGKTDIYQDRKIGLLPFQDNLSYFAIDLDRMLRQRPQQVQDLFAEVMTFFADGTYQPLPLTQFPVRQTIDSFRYMSQRKNIGKVVVNFDPESTSDESSRSAEPPPQIRQDGTYVVTGGLGALGMRIARWLGQQEAGCIALLSRREPSTEQQAALRQIETEATRVIALQGDVTQLESLQAAIAALPDDAPPIRGIIHAAGVLADGILADMSLEQLERARAPKLQGTWNLHLASREMQLDWFVLFSSVASVLGSPGQANYAAGNAFLDAIVHERRRQGLPGTTINWGPWGEGGMATAGGRDESIKARGMDLLDPAAALQILADLLEQGYAQTTVMDAHWEELLRLTSGRRVSLLADFETQHASAATSESGQVDHALKQSFLAGSSQERQSKIAAHIQGELARIMGVEPETLQLETPLSEYGIDSLLALELKNNLEAQLDFSLPMAALMEGPSISSLATETTRIISDDAPGEADSASNLPLLIEMNRIPGETPWILLPGLGGDIRCYDQLATHWPEESPLAMFRFRGLDENETPIASMNDTVREFADILIEKFPDANFKLAGWSTAGIYAFALTHELLLRDKQVEHLVLCDSPLPSVFDKVDVTDDARFLCDVISMTNALRGSEMRVVYEELKAMDPSQRFATVMAEARQKNVITADAPDDFLERVVHIAEANVRSLQGFQPAPLPGNVSLSLLVPEEKGGLSEIAGEKVNESGDLGWAKQIGQELRVHEIEGNHVTMILGRGAKQIAHYLAAPNLFSK